MTTSTQSQETVLPAGTWTEDTAHSSASFAVKYLVSTFTGNFPSIDAKLEVAEDGSAKLYGNVKAESVAVRDENLTAHLKAPDFFDVEQYPEIKFESTELTRNGEDLVVNGDLTIKGNTKAVEGRGTFVGPLEDAFGNTKVGVTVETTIDRAEFGLSWNADLPSGGKALSNEVKLVIELHLIKA
jgi:polyisoprenoid-binding protein YceI